MKNYLELMSDILNNGETRSDRTGTGTCSLFGTRLEFDLREGFPLVTTRQIYFKSVIYELLWFLKGSTNTAFLNDNNVKIWDKWATLHGELGPIYGQQWRSWRGNVLNFDVQHTNHVGDKINFSGKPVYQRHDQISELIRNLKINPFSRRHVISAWNVADLPDESVSPQENVLAGRMALAPCHMMAQFYVHNLPGGKRGLSCQFHMRTSDVPVGLPYNIASYALLTHMLAHVLGYEPQKLIYTGGDTHIYLNQVDLAKIQVERVPFDLPSLKIKEERQSIFAFKPDDFELLMYMHHTPINYPVSV